MKLIKNTIIATALAFATNNMASAAVLDISTNGTLIGAMGVEVNGIKYDVMFRDGIMEQSISSFTNIDDSRAASAALLSQVLVGDYLLSPQKINGCSSDLSCGIYTPYAVEEGFKVLMMGAWFQIGSQVVPSTIGAIYYPSYDSTSYFPNATLAIWTPSVPLPESYVMMFSGLGLLVFLAHHRKKGAA